MIARLMLQVGEWNPQLFRELKGRLKTRNIVIASAISIIGQFLTHLYYLSLLPLPPNRFSPHEVYNRYCAGSPPNPSYPYYGSGYCTQDLNGNWIIFKQLWWLDIFTFLSVVGIFAMLVVGVYMLITDLSKEERRGTLNFIRLSPQTAKSIFIGKILGVPILLYLVAALALPLHLIAGISAQIPLLLILTFYGVLIASCALFYNMALLFGLISGSLGGFQAWFGSGMMMLFLMFMTPFVLSGYFSTRTPFDWVTLFYPGTILPYLVKSTFLPNRTVNYLDLDNLKEFAWYGQNLWANVWTVTGAILLNFGWWTYCFTQMLKRRFHNPVSTVLNKPQSYLISSSFVIILLGFVFQQDSDYNLFMNFTMLQVFLVFLFLLLIPALSPHRQTLQDWSRYRYKNTQDRSSLVKELLLGDKSPAALAIAINWGIVLAYLTPAILLSNLDKYALPTFLGLVFGANIILIYALIAQRMLLMRSSKRLLAMGATIATLIVLPIVCFVFFRIDPTLTPWPWLFSVLPVIATEDATASMVFFSLLGQWGAIALLSFHVTKKVRHLGESQAKMLLASSS